jgi:tRNA (adenine57-N1/adenine58-N1)-methyltransferase
MKVLLLGKDKSFLADTSQKIFSCEYGSVDLRKAKIGKKIKASSGEIFSVVNPTIADMMRRMRRGPQIIMPKDAASIVALTGTGSGWRCLDAGAGSGFLAIFLGYVVSPNGSVTTYEKKKEFKKNIEHNIKLCGLEKIVKLKIGDAKKFVENNLDLITLDMPDAESMVKKAHKALKTGGFLVVYSPHIEQQKNAALEMAKAGFVQIHTIENIQREWSLKNFKHGFSHPKPSGIMHTGFITFGRKY